MNTTVEKKWYQSSNFWTAAVLMIGGAFVGFPEQIGTEVVGLIFGLIAGGKSLQNFLDNAKLDMKAWAADANFWNYLGTIIVAIVPTLPAETITHLETAVVNAIGGNWQGMIIALFSLGTILYKVLKPQPTPATA